MKVFQIENTTIHCPKMMMAKNFSCACQKIQPVFSQDESLSQDSNPSQNDSTQYSPSPQPTTSDMSISPNVSQTLASNSIPVAQQQQPQEPDNNDHTSNSLPLANRRGCNGCIGMYWDVLVM